MKTLKLLLFSALVVGGLGVQSAVQSQSTTAQETTGSLPVLTGSATGSVAGRITLGGKGVAGIAVALRNSGPDRLRPALMGSTDPEGNYQIGRVPAGQYQVAPVAPAFVVPEVTRSGGKLVILMEGENVSGIDFSLVKAGVITGKVLDAEGKPVVEERVNLLAVDSEGQNAPPPMLNFQTDDRGVYRIFGILAGRYKVAVGQGTGALGIGRLRRPYKLTFHPDATDSADAAIIEVLEGGESSGIDITVGRMLDRYAASGRIIDGQTGQPLANIRLGVASRTNRASSYQPVGSLSSSRGEFKVEGLTPGPYSVVISSREENSPFADPVPLDIVDHDVDDLIIKTSRGATLTGTVVLEGSDDKALLARLYQSRVNVWVRGGPLESPTSRSATINPDGSFRLSGLPVGTANLNLSSLNGPLKDFVVLRIEQEGITVTRGIELRSQGETSGVRILAAHGTGVIRGKVNFVNGALPPGSRVMAQLATEGPSASLRSAEVDARGRFAIEGIPAGSYSLQILRIFPGTRNRPVRQAVNVVDGVVTEVTVTLDLNPNPGSKP